MSTTTNALTPAQGGPNGGQQRQGAERQSHPDIDQQRRATEQQVQNTLDAEAIAAIDETEKAIDSISRNKTEEALAAIERATGKLKVLLARNPSTALIPVRFAIDIIDTAPRDVQAIRDIIEDINWALDDRDLPSARVLLYSLMSEILVRTFTLPLATYPDALSEAARLVDQKKAQEASSLLLTALNTLVAVDQVIPIPLLLARAAVDAAQSMRDKEKNAANAQLERAEEELQLCQELGYAARDPEYLVLRDSISEVKKQLKNQGDTGSAFEKVKDKLAKLVKRQSDREQSQQQACRHQDEDKRQQSQRPVHQQVPRSQQRPAA